MIVFGQQMYGKVDTVPGLCYVVTRFFHIWFIPLIPLGSYILIAGTDRGIPISPSVKSILIAWLRAALIAGLAIAGFFVIWSAVELANGEKLALRGLSYCTILAISFVFCYWLTLYFTRASYRRALSLADQLGFPAELVHERFPPTLLDDIDAVDSTEPDRRNHATEG
jgi:hypothetical protein